MNVETDEELHARLQKEADQRNAERRAAGTLTPPPQGMHKWRMRMRRILEDLLELGSEVNVRGEPMIWMGRCRRCHLHPHSELIPCQCRCHEAWDLLKELSG